MQHTKEEIADYIKATRKIAKKMPVGKVKAFFKQSYQVFEELDKETQQLFVSVFERLSKEALIQADKVLKEAKDFPAKNRIR